MTVPESTVTLPAADTRPGRLLGQLAAVLTLACLCMLAMGAVHVSRMYGARWEPRDLEWINVAGFITSVIAAVWLIRLAGPSAVRAGAAAVLGTATVFVSIPGFPYPDLGQPLFGCTVGWLALNVCRAHGVVLDNGFPATPTQRLRLWRATVLSAVFCAATGYSFGYLVRFFRWLSIDGIPVMQDSQLSTLGISSPATVGLAIVYAVAFEDVVIVAATAALMTAAGRPRWEIYTLVCALEVALHAYYGIPAIGAIIFAAGRLWLYLRYRSILPLMAGHALWNAKDFLLWIPAAYRLPMVWCVLIPGLVFLNHRLRTAADKEPEIQRRLDRGAA
ncbi:hypothetical protein ACH4Y0_03160 [Streptomyces sp. NPDC020707]|uniref:hypothetical protein n=1 Tax=Streptomyces sp. NPDC020707 TaxID=3365084 RepID=UPI0037ADBA38